MVDELKRGEERFAHACSGVLDHLQQRKIVRMRLAPLGAEYTEAFGSVGTRLLRERVQQWALFEACSWVSSKLFRSEKSALDGMVKRLERVSDTAVDEDEGRQRPLLELALARATHGALPHRAPSTRCTAECMHHVWHRCSRGCTRGTRRRRSSRGCSA